MKRAVPIYFALMFAVFFPVMNAQAKETELPTTDVKVTEIRRVNEPPTTYDLNHGFQRFTVHVVLQANKTIYKAHMTCGKCESIVWPHVGEIRSAYVLDAVALICIDGYKTACYTIDDSVDATALREQSAPTRKNIPAIVKAADGAIVTIITAANDKPIALGTGFLVGADGAIVTNYHVIRTGNVAAVKFSDGTVLPVDGLVAADKVRDLALIKIHGKNFRTLTLGNSDRIQVGEEVVAIGNPLGLELTVSNGILSGVRTVEKESGKFLQITAPISHGSSGGPLFNMSGEVIGITSMYFEGGENLNFAIPANDAKRLLLNQSATLSSLPNEPEEAEPSAKVASQTTLQKDISWMNRFLREHSERGAVFGIKIAEPGVRDTFNGLMHDDLSGKEDCVVSVRRNATGSDWTVLMSFTDINPAKIEVFDDMMQFITLGEKQKMIIGQPGNSTFTLIPNSNFIFDSPNSAERFSQVFRHAVAFCGENQQKRVENTN